MAEAALRARLAEAEAECEALRAQVAALTRTPATHHPTEGRRWLSEKPAYPAYDLSDPKGSFERFRSFLVADVLPELREGYELPEAEVEWTKKMLDYNTAGGKMNRGLMVVEAGVALFRAKGLEVTNEAVCRFAVVGWCVEFLQAWLLMLDDIMDDSQTRRGQPCWYLQPHVQKIAINDGLVVEGLTYKILKRHFAGETFYPQLLDLFFETTFQTELGQMLDTLCLNLGLDDFTEKRWELIVKYKTSFYSFYMSVAAGMILAGIQDVEEFDRAREILVIMGVYFQAQDDFLDCFGTAEQIGKIGTDIQDKKCGWLFVHAFNSLASPEQKEFFRTHYGNCKVGSPEEQRIKEIYAELGLRELYEKYEQESYDKIMKLRRDDAQVPWEVFEVFLKKIYKRTK